MNSGLHFIFLHLENDFCLGGIEEGVNAQGHSGIRGRKFLKHLPALPVWDPREELLHKWVSTRGHSPASKNPELFHIMSALCTQAEPSSAYCRGTLSPWEFLVAQTKEQGSH